MSFLRDYLFYANKNEAPPMFHVWCGYGALSAAIGRRIWLPRGENVVYPNIYVLLVGAAGCGKSTAIYKVKRLLAELGNVPISASIETPEGLCRFMAGDNKADPPIESPCVLPLKWPDGQIRSTHGMTILANEFIDFISKNQEGWTSMLNNIYDEDKYDYRTKGKGEDILVGPYIVLLGAIPTEIQKKLQRDEIITTGFARRTFMQYGERQFHNPQPDPVFTDEEQAARERCLVRLKKIQEFRGPMLRTPEAAKWWHNWYTNHSLTLVKRATPATQGWLSSKPDQVIKLAILNSLSERDDLTVTKEDYELSLAYITEMEKSFGMVFGGIGRNELAPIAMKVLEYLTNLNEPQSFKVLLSKFFHSFSQGKGVGELSEILSYLISIDAIQQKRFKVGPIEEEVYATPEAFAVLNGQITARPSAATLNASLQDSAVVIDPLTVLPSIPTSQSASDQTEPPPVS